MHERFMRRCIELARQAKAAGNIPVGSLVTLDNAIIAEASEELPATLNITGHAEVLAVQKACDTLQSMRLDRCTLYTTAEPCWMCSYTIRETRIQRVVFGSRLRDVGGMSTAYPLLTDDSIAVWDTPPEIITGVMEAECLQLRA